MNFSKIPCNATAYSLEDNSNLMKVKITVMHEGINHNGSKFALQDMKRAEETIKNIPILGYVLRDTDGGLDDFDGHNMETRIKDGDNGFEIETYYLEKPIGVVPESCNPRYEIVDGLNHLVVDGYIWKSYSNGSYKLIENSLFKGVSMEIEVLDGKWNELEDVYDITDYRYTGITILGNHVEPAMGDTCRVQKYSVCANYKEALSDIYKEIYSLERREDNMEELKNELIVEETTEEVVEVQEVEAEEVVEETIEETVEEVVEAVEEESVEEEIADQVTEEIIEETEVVEEVEATEEVVEDNLDIFANLLEEVPQTLKEVADVLTEKFSAMNDELKVLREFKSNIDLMELKKQVEEVSNKYDLDVDTTELKEKAIASDITLEQFEKELKVLFAEKILENGKFSKIEKEETTKVVITSNEEINTIYGGLFEKHGLK